MSELRETPCDIASNKPEIERMRAEPNDGPSFLRHGGTRSSNMDGRTENSDSRRQGRAVAKAKFTEHKLVDHVSVTLGWRSANANFSATTKTTKLACFVALNGRLGKVGCETRMSSTGTSLRHPLKITSMCLRRIKSNRPCAAMCFHPWWP